MTKKKNIIIAAVLALLAIGVALAYVKYVYPRVVEPAEVYSDARELYNSGNYLQAALKLDSISKYLDSAKLAKQAWKLAGDSAYNKGDFDMASTCYKNAGSAPDDIARMDECYFRLAENAFATGMNSRGEVCLSLVSSAAGNTERMDQVRLDAADAILNSGITKDSVVSAVDILSRCSDAVSGTISDRLVARGRQALSSFDLDCANTLFNESRRFCGEYGLESLNSRINAEWTEAGLNASAKGLTAIAEKCFDLSGYVPELDNAEAEYARAEQLYAEGNAFAAYSIFKKLGNYKDSAELTQSLFERISRIPNAGPEGAYALLGLDGTVKQYGNSWETGEPEWSDLKHISVGKTPFILGVTTDGRVLSSGRDTDGCTNVSSWDGIIQAACGGTHSIGLRANGTVVFAGSYDSGVNETASWREIVYIASGSNASYGVTLGGRVLASGDNSAGQCEVSDWTDIAMVSGGNQHAVALKNDGTVVACGDNTYGQCDVSEWKDVIFVSAGAYHTVALKSDGTLLACGKNDNGECAVSRFNGAAAVSAGNGYTLIVFEDGTNRLIGSNN